MSVAGACFGGGGESGGRGMQASVDDYRWISSNWSFGRCSTVCIPRQSMSMLGPRLRVSLSANSPSPTQAAAAKPQASRRNDGCTGAWISSGNSGFTSLGVATRSRANLVTAFRRQSCRLTRPKGQQRPASCSAVDRHVDAEAHASSGFEALAESSSEGLAGGRDSLSEELGDDANPAGNGKTGFVSFYQACGSQREATGTANMAEIPKLTKDWKSLLWILGPVTLVTSVVVPPLYLRTVSEALLQDSLLTDFVILFFTESCFYAGALVFLYLADKFGKEVGHGRAPESFATAHVNDYPLGYQVSTSISLALGVLLPIVTLFVVWSWTGPAAAAALLPYILGLVVQLSFEQIARARNSSVWPVVPVIFQVYRLHQLNRAAQLVAGLLFSLRGAETTAETLAINGALRTLLSVLQLLGILSLWCLSSFLSHGFSTWARGRIAETAETSA